MAVSAARKHVEEGYRWVADMDLEKFFDRVNHDVLMSRIAKRIGDKRILKLIRAYLNAGVMVNGVVMEREEGTPQGGPLSPLLANILLDEFDKELEKRGHAFCRYADDCNIYVASKRAGERVMESLTQFLEGKLRLKVNRAKSAVAKPYERKFLGLRILRSKEAIIGIAPKSIARFKNKVRQITKRNRGISLTRMIEEPNRYTMGWVNYFGIARAKDIMEKAGVGPWLAYGIASGKHGPWNVAGSPAMTKAVPSQYLEQRGYKSLCERYTALTSY